MFAFAVKLPSGAVEVRTTPSDDAFNAWLVKQLSNPSMSGGPQEGDLVVMHFHNNCPVYRPRELQPEEHPRRVLHPQPRPLNAVLQKDTADTWLTFVPHGATVIVGSGETWNWDGTTFARLTATEAVVEPRAVGV